MKKKLSLYTLLAALATAMTLTGCGGGGGGGGTSAGSTTGTNDNQGGASPADIGGKTFNGRIGTTSTTWQIVFTGSGNSGTYAYSENGKALDSGNYTYTKTGSNTGVVTLGDGTTLELTYGSANSGSYLISKSSETGSFTST